MTQAELINKYTERIMVDYPEADKIHIDLMQFAEELRQCNVVGQCAHPRDKREYIGSNMLRCKICGKEFS